MAVLSATPLAALRRVRADEARKHADVKGPTAAQTAVQTAAQTASQTAAQTTAPLGTPRGTGMPKRKGAAGVNGEEKIAHHWSNATTGWPKYEAPRGTRRCQAYNRDEAHECA